MKSEADVAAPYALPEDAILLAKQGRLRRAYQVVNKSCAIAKLQGATVELNESRLARGRIGHQLNLPRATDDIETAESQLFEYRQWVEKFNRVDQAQSVSQSTHQR